MSEEEIIMLAEMRDNCLNASVYDDENRLLKANAITKALHQNKEIERLNNILDEIDLIFYRMRFVEFNSIKDELKFLYENINTVRKICQNKKIEESDKE